MRTNFTVTVLLFFGLIFFSPSALQGQKWNNALEFQTEEIRMNDQGTFPKYIRFKPVIRFADEAVADLFRQLLNLSRADEFREVRRETDELGIQHIRYQQFRSGVPVAGGMYIIHQRNGIILSANGDYYPVEDSRNAVLISAEALELAKKALPAVQYKWEIPGEEEHLKEITGNPNATWKPAPELCYVPAGLEFGNKPMQLAWKVCIYSEEPLAKENIFLDAVSGEEIARENLLHNTDVPATAVTKYSGNRSMTTDSTAPGNYRLREALRGTGNGMTTLNMKKGSSYGAAVDFTDADNYWNNVNANKDEVATDAHWGAEMVYDYFKNIHSRNSFDGSGAKIISYVHYGNNYNNAFWNGSYMTYGDGDGTTFTPLTALDVCGHEVAHAVTTYSAGLVYSYESGALNESFSDCFGNAIEIYGRPTKWNWKIGEDITPSGNGIRNMTNPNLRNHPKYYKGLYWYSGAGDNGGVHTNSGVQNWWFYLLSMGGKGNTEVGAKPFSVDSLGVLKAGKIAYRNLTVYLTSSSNYADARYYSIKAATDLYGDCSKEVIATTNAWFACGVGAAYDSGTVKADFLADTFVCYTGKNAKFYNKSSNYKSVKWYFGDNDTSNLSDPVHAYANYGTYTVKLVARSCFKNKLDSITRVSYVKVDSTSDICQAVLMPLSGTDSISKCQSYIYDDGGLGNYAQQRTTYLKVGVAGADSIQIRFYDLDYENKYDSLYLYKGAPKAVNKIGGYTGSTLPNAGKTITVIGNYFSLKHFSDPLVVGRGFKLYYKAFRKPLDVNISAAKDTVCYGDSTNLIASGSGGFPTDYSYTWADGPSGNNRWVKPLSKTTYKVYLRDVCSRLVDSSEYTIYVRQPLQLALSDDTIVCAGRTAELRAAATGGRNYSYTYTWTPALSNAAVQKVTPAATTQYRLILSDGCTPVNDTAYMTVFVKPVLSAKAAISDSVICVSQSVTLSAAGSGGDTSKYVFTWNKGLGTGKNKTTTPASTGWYKVTLSDGCSVQSSSDSVFVRVRPALKVSLNNDTTLCRGSSLTLNATSSGGKGTYTWIWNQGLGNSQTHTVTPAAKTTYTVTLRDNCSPDVKDSVVLDLLAPLQLSNLKDTTICNNGTADFTAVASGGRAATRLISWNNGAGTGAVKSLKPASTTAYQIVLSDGCTVKNDTAKITVTVRPALSVSISATPTQICEGDSTELNITASGGVPSQYLIKVNGAATALLKYKVAPPVTTGYTVDLSAILLIIL